MDNQAWARTESAFARQRAENEREEDRRRQEIAARLPALDTLLKERHRMVLSSVRGAFSAGTPRDPEGMMAEYNQKIAALLKENGYPADYLSPVCRCPLCGDQGFVYDHSVRRPCACFLKACEADQNGQRDREQSAETFAAFDEARFPDALLPGTDVTQREYMRVVRDKCRRFAESAAAGGSAKTLLLHGGSGLGKTFLLRCVGAQAREMGMDTMYTTAYDLLMALRAAYFSRTGETAEEYFSVPLLLIDDLGMEPLIENVTVEQLYNLLNARLTRGLYTGFSTNLSREEIKARYTERVSSRLLDTRSGVAIPFMGKDIRLIK